ncbi:LysE family translocator [Cytophagaceae bacterium DM2B3-1]|uniref:LysE family translocator n=2 Tax=Xanthocytophaga flava TaxID=3048013 RepID=A0ABT7CIP1_9BACT|nr:LysE family translocator [Xanthocytophaga flavus]
MIGIDNFLVFSITALIFIMTPGIDTIFILNKSISQGKRAGIFSTIGTNSGVLLHTLFAALGLSLIVAQSALAFSLVKYAGALYLLFLGISALRSRDKKMDFDKKAPVKESDWKNFRTGFMTNILNPKVALFFLSFFPQFIKKEYSESPVPFIILGCTCALLGMIWFLTLTFFSALFSQRLKNNPGFNQYLNKASGMVYVGMGIKVAITEK